MELQKQLVIKEKLKQYLIPGYFAVVGPSDYLWFERFKSSATNIATRKKDNVSLKSVLSNDDVTTCALEALPEYIDYSIYIYNKLSFNNKSAEFLTLQEYCKLCRLNVSALSLNIL